MMNFEEFKKKIKLYEDGLGTPLFFKKYNSIKSNIDFNNNHINCNGYVNVKIFAKFLSTIRPKQNHESIGINENIAELKAILNNLFICSPLFMYEFS